MKHTVRGLGGTETSRPHHDAESGLPPGGVLDPQVYCSLKEGSAFCSTRKYLQLVFVVPPTLGAPEEEGLWGRRQSVKEKGGQGRV